MACRRSVLDIYSHPANPIIATGENVGKRITFRIWLLFLIASGILLVGSQQAASQNNSAAQVHDRAAALLRQMTLDEKIAQLSQLPGLPAPEFKENISQPMEEVLKQNGAGSILWVPDPSPRPSSSCRTIRRSTTNDYSATASFSITTFRCAVTSLCSFTGTVNSPTVFSGSWS